LLIRVSMTVDAQGNVYGADFNIDVRSSRRFEAD
jgi:hypothetical protein